MTGPDTFHLLNVEARCAVREHWQDAGSGRLWRYNLHYFDDLNAVGADQRLEWHRALIERWVTENPPGSGIGWEPYPVSRRIINWVKWTARGNQLSESARLSLAIQLRWLETHLEFHILGNHLFANAKALVFGGLRFQGGEAQRWLDRGLRLVERELREQVLEDGGHFELSPMYHAAVLEDLLDLCNVARAAGVESIKRHGPLAVRMQRWLEHLTHPDGEISFFNDATFGVAPTAARLREYAGSLGVSCPVPERGAGPLTHLADSGYLRASRGPGELFCDCAPVGPDYLPGHAHADTLSFEFSLRERRLFVNSGTSRYEPGPERERQRGTAAHNTVVIDGQDSSEVWGSFRVARRAYPRVLEAVVNGDEVRIQGGHDGYRRLGAGEVKRRWTLTAQMLRIDDEIGGVFREAVARFHLHPDVVPAPLGPETFELRIGDRIARIEFRGARTVRLLQGSWHPRFGEARRNHCFAVEFSSNRLSTELHWRD